MTVLWLVLGLLFGPPTNLTYALRAVSFAEFKVQFGWRAPDTVTAYRYNWRLGERTGSTAAKSATVKLVRSYNGLNGCVQAVAPSGATSIWACREYTRPRVDTTTIVDTRRPGYGTSVKVTMPHPPNDTVSYCAFAWVRGKVIRDPRFDWTPEGMTLILGTTEDYRTACLPRVPPKLLWPLP